MDEVEVIEGDDSAPADAFDRNQRYLYSSLSPAQRSQSGFLRVLNTLPTLRTIHSYEAIAQARVNGRIAGHYYFLPDYLRPIVADVSERLQVYETVEYQGKPVTEYRFCEILQIIVEAEFQRRGVAGKMVKHAIERLTGHYDLLVVKIMEDNDRSLKFHRSMGFQVIGLVETFRPRRYILVIDLRQRSKL